ncbi:AIR carboxylase [Posidoniimonas polymericola]|uniref:AIR carboxylase n=1 Tax=Posidoniimonas polymericola TaxID=2528002 RepID=A0A5C5ZF22_9BACT|nr:nickel pincer cofactor biosynthesis protein LarB [Posidoniimonas polymericola]TWT85657.1 AIR carboxylase [Posidoniimonas polymericola]
MDPQTPRHKSLAGQTVTVDLDRRRRCGFPEVVYGEGKTVEAIAAVFDEQHARGEPAMATRVSPEQAEALLPLLSGATYNQVARILRRESHPGRPRVGKVAVVSAGSSDLPIAEEARETLDWMGVAVTMVHDVGVAGPHRLPERLAEFEDADAVVVVAGMEGALPSVVGGYLACPVVGVPTSVGYGANFQGLSALLSMLNSCASNVTVVNIDAGFKGGYVAGLIATRAAAGTEGRRDA